MKAGGHLVQLERMLAMKERRLDNWAGAPEGTSWLRADIAALRFALDVIDTRDLDDLQAIAVSKSRRRGAPA